MEFRYTAIDPQGQTLSGQISAAGERDALRLLRERELTPVDIGPAAAGARGRARPRRASEQEKSIVVRELATLLGAGVSLGEAVESIGLSHTDSLVGEAFLQVHGKLRGGERFSEGLRSGPVAWPDYLYQLVMAGEQTGKLAQALASAADQMDYEQRVRAEMRNALIYPSILVFSGIAAVLVIFVVVVPKFAGILRNTRAQVPDISIWVLQAGLFVREHLGWILIAGAALAALAARALASPERRSALVQRLARAPLLGPWLVETEIGRWAAMLGTLLENRVPILAAMELTQEGMRLASVRRKLQQAARDVRGGRSLADSLAGVNLLTVTGLNMVRVGERSGELSGMLRALATLHETAGRERLKRFLILLEPIAIVLIGGVIGFIMVSIMLAITSISNVPI